MHSPSLLRQLHLEIPPSSDPGALHPIDRYRGFCAWLQQRAAPHVQQLQLMAPLPFKDADSRSAGEHATVAALACCTGLQTLDWQAGILRLEFGEWAEALSQLEECRISARSTAFSARWAHLQSLRSLGLAGEVSAVHPDASFPASLTRLSLHNLFDRPVPPQVRGGAWSAVSAVSGECACTGCAALVLHIRLPTAKLLRTLALNVAAHQTQLPQVTALSELRHLTLDQCSVWDASQYSTLLHLSRLRCLQLCGCFPLPACLGQLSQLEALSVTDWHGHSLLGMSREEECGPVAAAALASLAGLTALELQGMLGMPAPPASLTSLRALQRFVWYDTAQSPWGQQEERQEPADLPVGDSPAPWLGALRLLGLPVRMLHRNLTVLEAATQLQRLIVLDVGASEWSEAAGIVRWAAQHAGLRQVHVHLTGGSTKTEREHAQEVMAAAAADLAGGGNLEVSVLSL